MNTSVSSIIAEFAKINKISKAKTEAFAANILANVPKAGRKTTDEALRIREAIKAATSELGPVFTAKDVANRINASPVNVGNALKYLAEKDKCITLAGKKEKEQGKRGRKELLWKIA